MPNDADDNPRARRPLANDLRGASRLAVDAVTGVSQVVEGLHRSVSGRGTGLSGLVYRSVRGVAQGVGQGLDAALASLGPLLGATPGGARREALLAALNGVLGDHLAESANPLAIPLQFRQAGQPVPLEPAALATALPRAGSGVLLLVHGLCMNDLQWQRRGHDHGEVLARELGLTPLYLHYNSGQHISHNGQALATALQQLVQAWPQPVERLVIVGHSMGGLVARSACHSAEAAGLGWRQVLRELVFLGTPHHGAPLERAGNWAQFVAGFSPYALPFTGLARVRSAGIRDLRHGNLLDSDWAGIAASDPRDARTPVPLPAGVAAYAVAATQRSAPARGRPPGDGLVPVDSALGRHRNPVFDLGLPTERQWLAQGMNHFDLLSSRAVCEQLLRWLG
ncbi:esterase/lipase family protein [Ideonella sp. BN130291]|uniref:esterase/lipase family protein n=1 Tax=Ideonella sp. BN130291 TaxID=3112940 RepID=UPI002E27537B|nr:alpha/beta hydrolase [Ideonella sp. BN130291]